MSQSIQVLQQAAARAAAIADRHPTAGNKAQAAYWRARADQVSERAQRAAEAALSQYALAAGLR